MKKILVLSITCFFCLPKLSAQPFETTKNLKKETGFFNFYYQEFEDRIFLEVKNLNTEFLYLYALSSGVGSNDIGLDRGQLGREQIVYFKKAGNKLLLVQPNLNFRASTSNKLEKLSVQQAFAKSVLFGFPILETKNDTYLIDITDFLLLDAHDVSGTLLELDQGDYELDLSKSALEMQKTKAFPKNVEFEALLTFNGHAEGSEINSVAPNPNLISVIEHHSFIELPDAKYKTRAFDPRCGSYPISYMDYSAPIQESITKRLITRHRLEKKNPTAQMSEAIEPIIYYLDNGTPEPVRSALLDGGRWWNQAFENIGYKDAFQIKILPDDADPMDVRYNVIQWVHRSTRGWSYGSSVIDPRTGEIIKGHVSLGSLRIRQDFLIAQALMNKPFAQRDDNYEPMLELALARIRQLSAHEIGHTLGFAHNFAASTNDRASVMDYPHPKLSISNGEIDFSDAYDDKIGVWDKLVVAYSYSQFENNEKERLDQILNDGYLNGLRYISDSDARPAGGSHAYAHLWDNGNNATSELENILAIRQTAINNFSKDNIKSGEPFSVLEDVFVPLYFLHRYQIEATAKLIGGMNYNYAVKGDGQLITKVVDSGTQRNALSAIVKTLSPDVLTIPKDKLDLFPPRAMGYEKTSESFNSKSGPAFDPLSAAATASDMTLKFVFNSQRAARLIQQYSLDKDQLSLGELIDTVTEATFSSNKFDELSHEVFNTVKFTVINHLIKLANDESTLPQVNATVKYKLKGLREKLITDKKNQNEEIYNEYLVDQIDQMKVMPSSKAVDIPDGSPIGMACFSN